MKKEDVVLSVISIWKFKNPKISCIFYKTLVLCIICGKCGIKDGKLLNIGEPSEILKILCLNKNI